MYWFIYGVQIWLEANKHQYHWLFPMQSWISCSQQDFLAVFLIIHLSYWQHKRNMLSCALFCSLCHPWHPCHTDLHRHRKLFKRYRTCCSLHTVWLLSCLLFWNPLVTLKYKNKHDKKRVRVQKRPWDMFLVIYAGRNVWFCRFSLMYHVGLGWNMQHFQHSAWKSADFS